MGSMLDALQASNLYQNIQSRPRLNIDLQNDNKASIQTVEGAHNFQKVFKSKLNKFAGMDPHQILDHIRSSKHNFASNSSDQPTFQGSISRIRTVLDHQESTVRKSLVNEATLAELLTATTQATNELQTIVKIRDQVIGAYDKVFSMNL